MGRDSADSLFPFFRRARILPHVPRAVLARVLVRARYVRASGTFRFLPSLLHPYAVNRCPIVDLG